MNRSYLFIPGNTPSMIQTLDVFNADAIIIDLEDSVDVSDKDAALDLVQTFLETFDIQDTDIYVRVNDYQYAMPQEIDTLNQTAIKGYVIPKASKSLISQVASLTDKPLIALIETPRSVMNALKIADSTQVIGLILGAEDLTQTLRIERTSDGDEIQFARHQICYAAHAAGIEAIDTPFTKPNDTVGLIKDTRIAKSIGFTGKTAIHPNQVADINQQFIPNEQAIHHAKRIIAKAKQNGKGAFSLDGKMIDKPIINRAKQVLTDAKHAGILAGDDDE
ncbi:MAG: CoA ester lyase [Candidatus Izemoplasma sp.]|nr:CoA ester lyase [Candidatus Izemoplasma sp.]